MRPEEAPHTVPSRGIACVLAAPPPAHTGEDRVIRGEGVSPTYPPPQGLRLAGPRQFPTAPHWPGGAPGGSFGLAPRGAHCGIPLRAVPRTPPAPGEPLPPERTKRSPSWWRSDDSGVPWAPSSSRGGTAPRARVRGSSPIFADLVPRPGVGLMGLPLGPISRGPMASADAARRTAGVDVGVSSVLDEWDDGERKQDPGAVVCGGWVGG